MGTAVHNAFPLEVRSEGNRQHPLNHRGFCLELAEAYLRMFTQRLPVTAIAAAWAIAGAMQLKLSRLSALTNGSSKQLAGKHIVDVANAGETAIGTVPICITNASFPSISVDTALAYYKTPWCTFFVLSDLQVVPLFFFSMLPHFCMFLLLVFRPSYQFSV